MKIRYRDEKSRKTKKSINNGTDLFHRLSIRWTEIGGEKERKGACKEEKRKNWKRRTTIWYDAWGVVSRHRGVETKRVVARRGRARRVESRQADIWKDVW